MSFFGGELVPDNLLDKCRIRLTKNDISRQKQA